MRQVFEEIDARWGTRLVGEFHNYIRVSLSHQVWLSINSQNTIQNFVINISQNTYRFLASQDETAHD